MSQDIIIRQAVEQDRVNITNFFNDNWGKRHNLINYNVFFDYYFVDTDDKLNFVIGINESTNEIFGACGYVCSNRQKNPTVWTTLWLTKKSTHINLGLEILEEIKRITNCEVLCSNNIAPKTAMYYRFLGYKADKLNHYYRLNDIQEYRVAKIKNKNILQIESNGYDLVEIKTIKELESIRINNKNSYPNKDITYIKKRYYECPFYKYSVYAIQSNKSDSTTMSLLITRSVEVNETKVLRIVDFIGEDKDVMYIGEGIQKIMDNEKYEYVDFYCYGIKDEYLITAGFNMRGPEDVNIIPNYLEPLSQENVEYLFFTNKIEGFHMYKADGDQDRPNIVV